MTHPFPTSSYLSQVRHLRKMAEAALRNYRITVKHLHFINHGENTTFRVDAKDGRRYLLRLHRPDYHTQAGVLEELRWLKNLNRGSGITVPRPVAAINGKLTVSVTSAAVSQARMCDVFHWIEGTFYSAGVTEKKMFELGQLTARLQNHAPKHVVHRIYWNAEGLAGKRAKWGGVDDLYFATPKQRILISKTRRDLYKRLSRFEKRFPDRMGMIHADLHFRNILWQNGKLAAIDFDDCGFGFHAYDLAVPLISIADRNPPNMKALRQALIAGYADKKTWDAEDEKILEDLLIARRLAILMWFNMRLDNPKLKQRARGFLKRSLKEINRSQKSIR